MEDAGARPTESAKQGVCGLGLHGLHRLGLHGLH